MTIKVIKENALTEDTLYIADNGKVFGGGFVAIIEYFTYANEWGDHKHYKRFRTLKTMQAYLNKNYADCEVLA
jgi:hypothetical protein